MSQQQPPSPVPLQVYTNYAMSSPQVSFSELSLPPFCILYVWCLFWYLLSTFRCHAGCHIHLWQLNHWGLHHCNNLELTCGRHMCNLVMVISPHWVCIEWLFHPLPGVGEPSATQLAVPQPYHLYGGVYSFGGLAESPDPSAFLACGEGSSFPDLVPSHDMVNSESAMGIKPGDSGVVIGYHIDEHIGLG